MLTLRERLAAFRLAAARAVQAPPLEARPLPPSIADRGDRGAGGVPREVLRQVRLIELRTRNWVNSLFGGEYQSVFKGQGMEFAEVREYQVGDEVRTIDWNVTARAGHPYVKKYVEERELTVLLALDLSGSEQFGTRGRFKAELAAEIAAVLALAAVRNNDRVGLLIFTDHVEHFVPPKKGRRHVLRLIRDILAFPVRGTGTDLETALDYTGRILPHRSIVFLLSDFQLPGRSLVSAAGQDRSDGAAADTSAGAKRHHGRGQPDEPSGKPSAETGFERILRTISTRHDLVAVTITDAGEEALPDVGVLALTDPETGGEIFVDTGRARLRSDYNKQVLLDRSELRRLFRRLSVDEVEVRTDASYVTPLLAFFRRRERKLKR